MTKPASLPEWDTNELNSVEPDQDHKDEGWLAPGGIPEKPPFQTFNHWQNNVYKWLEYIDTELFPAGTSMVFNQASPPVGWTKKADWAANASLIVGNTYGTGGSDDPVSWATAVTVDAHSTHDHTGPSHTHTGPSHSHTVDVWANDKTGSILSEAATSRARFYTGNGGNSWHTEATASFASKGKRETTINDGTGATGAEGTGATGLGGPTTHAVNQDTYTPIYVILIAASRD